jgi:4-phospho-D-threonate 3-dehydrogenase / 4-phospho-D-erythronate 3-dehydrogenase
MVRIGITLGDPRGIGPEVIVKALDEVGGGADFVVYGAEAPLRDAAARAGCSWPSPGVRVKELGSGPWASDGEAGNLSFRCVDAAIAACKLPASDPNHIDAVVTGPISKEAWAAAGHRYPGHTELFAERFGSARFAMMFYAPSAPSAPSLNVILVTTHLPLKDVPGAITRERVEQTIALGDEAMRRLGVASARIAVCGLNPHAGENGLLGTEDRDVIAPAVQAARSGGIDAQGPFPADTIFARALHGPGLKPSFDLVVAMYHDQGLAPVKLIARDRTVNLTVGLPVVRTSPDHGTAFDIAGKNVADAGSMRAAIELAIRMAEERRPE